MCIVPVTSIFPEWTSRRITANCRAGRIKGAYKLGKSWVISTQDAALITAAPKAQAEATAAEAEALALADLRARGVL